MTDQGKDPHAWVREQMSGIPQSNEEFYSSTPVADPDRGRNRLLFVIALLLVVLDINTLVIALILAKQIL